MTQPILNSEQQSAVDNIEGPLMVLAGPGTGKTQIIAQRIAKILELTQLNPHNILCLTFTESGVVAMRKRLMEIVGTAAYHVRIHTFHSFCNDVIKDHPEKFIFTRELEALTEVERIQVFQKLINALPGKSTIKPFGAPYLYQKDLMFAIQNLKHEDISPDEFDAVLKKTEVFIKEKGEQIEEFISKHANSLKITDFEKIQTILENTELSFTEIAEEKKARTQLKNDIKKKYLDLKNQLPKQQALNKIYRSYQMELKTRGRYDFEDMILFVVNKFVNDEELLAKYQEQFQYILVDEYQDTNGAQNKVIELISQYWDKPNMFVVGDDKQSIYRFQGASLENILHFYRLYKEDLKIISLKENYRSHQGILDSAYSLIQNNTEGINKYLPDLCQSLNSATQIQKKDLNIAIFDTPETEHYFLAKRVQELIAEGTKASEIAILYRNNWDVRDVMDLFLRLEIPFRLEAGVNVLEDVQIKKIINLLHIIQDLTNDHKLFFALHYEFLNFNPLKILKLSTAAKKNKHSLIDEMLESPTFHEFAKLLLSWKSLSINRPLMEFIDHMIKESGYLDHALAQKDKVQQLNRLNSLFDEIKKMNRANHNLTLENLLDHLELLTENNIAIKEHELRTNKDAVRLMTAHKSKGLEFEHVFIMKCIDKHWGNIKSRSKLKLPKSLLKTVPQAHHINEDERRLFYVAITRAKQNVTFTYSKMNENNRPQTPSIFLQELGKTKELDTSAYEEEALQRLQTVFLEIPKEDNSKETEDFVKSLLQNYTMSVTHLNNYLRCPRIFYYNNVLRVPRAKTKHEAFGSAVHESLKDLSLQLKNEHKASKKYLLEQFKKHIQNQVLTQHDFHSSLEFGQETLSEYFDEYAKSFRPNVLPEFDFSSHGVNLDGIPLTGKLDKIEILADQNVHVVDYKTGNPDTKSQALGSDGDYFRQIVFYQLLCDLSPKFPYKMVSGEIDFIQKGKKGFRRKSYKISSEDTTKLKTIIKDVYEDIQNLRFINPDEWSTCGECEYCTELVSSVE